MYEDSFLLLLNKILNYLVIFLYTKKWFKFFKKNKNFLKL